METVNFFFLSFDCLTVIIFFSRHSTSMGILINRVLVPRESVQTDKIRLEYVLNKIVKNENEKKRWDTGNFFSIAIALIEMCLKL